MADEPPAVLRQADPNIYKTATRAAQLQSVKPIVSYWCDYWVLKQILAKGLHNSSPDILEYSSHLMDKMEQASLGEDRHRDSRDTDSRQIKAEHATEDAILDDTAGQAYVEQFAQETLDRAQRVVRANKVTAMTANTFDAAASFFGLVNIWGSPEQENLQKIKYAKWNAARILKALKEGKDPNESNPHLDEEEPGQELEPQESLSPGPAAPAVMTPRPVTIEDEEENDGDLQLPDAPSAAAHIDDTNPLRPSAPPAIPSVPSFDPADQVDAHEWAAPTPSPPAVQPEPYYQQQPQGFSSAPSAVTGFPPLSQPRAPAAAAAVDEAAMAMAQKHAKWAISALNFEDVTTAVRELHRALEFLGAS
ncbi:duf605 domain containing protein [Grosmannia clavigera kw1407]|uniref:Duf605 domain containing protein n=1 Tax=Grosmannia clavigera (strain kw1407 / UAMH 11150) TaxID=655863 RepID=F0XCT3_GROCL|nr:duf605 domain containing protein [Grosmannia clavigera kw1407]EFX03746.1 duf605 domain containing protein [Grosmannia clavigera kw1407]